ncbi:MAG: UDP-N-acetylglucosamine 1-carboxyvinyltransferase [Bacilli bacterium]
MPKIKIEGGHELTGEVTISGAKNSAVALIPASILSSDRSIIYNVPNIRDIEYLKQILSLLNCTYKEENGNLLIDSSHLENKPIPEELSREMRASYYFMGALLAKFKKVEINYPGGCKIGNRPIDLHIKGFAALGAKITEEKNHFTIEAEELKGANIYLDIASVGATINIMLAATLAKGKTVIENAAKEPEIVNIASFLINMGANIEGAGTSTIIINGVKDLKNGVIEVCPDRIEASTYLIMGALIGKDMIIKGAIKEHIEAVLIKLKETGANIKFDKGNLIISAIEDIKPTNIKTQTYPGFPTDVQQPFTVILTQATGKSIVEETIYESRFRNTIYLNMMGAKSSFNANKLEVVGKTKLHGTLVEATDLRAGASLLVAGLIAEGTTIIDNIELILRGYENVIEKLTLLGAKIEIIE